MTSLKYKALILDVDGTLIKGRYGSPSARVTKAVKQARTKLHVGLATSRPLFMLARVLKKLDLSGPSIINAGTTIIDVNTRQVLWSKTILEDDIESIFNLASDFKVKFTMHDGKKNFFKNGTKAKKKVFEMWAPNLVLELADEFIQEASNIPTIAVHKVPSWSEGKIDLLVTHAEATKQHGILEIAKILDISTKEIIGVGDGYNDFPLLMACGLKVAMGNAVPDLKAIADYVAPTVEEDGVADVIEKFVL